MKEEEQIYKGALNFLFYAQGLSYDLSKFTDKFIPFFRIRKTITKSLSKD